MSMLVIWVLKANTAYFIFCRVVAFLDDTAYAVEKQSYALTQVKFNIFIWHITLKVSTKIAIILTTKASISWTKIAISVKEKRNSGTLSGLKSSLIFICQFVLRYHSCQ